MLDDAITAGVDAGLFDVTDVHECGRALLGMVQSVASWFRADGRTSPQRLAREYVDIAAHTVGARPDVLARIRARAATA
jgi:hypothetical protein